MGWIIGGIFEAIGVGLLIADAFSESYIEWVFISVGFWIWWKCFDDFEEKILD